MSATARLPILLLTACLGLTARGSTQDDPAAPAHSEPAEPLRITTFNIRYGKADDGEDSWPNRKDHVVTTVRERDPHVLGLQEALRFQVDYLEEHLPAYGVIGQGRDGGPDGEWAALLYDRQRLELVRHGDFWLSPSPDEVASVGWDAALTRMCTWAVFRDQRTNTWFRVWNTHFDHRGGKARAESGKLIAERVADSHLPDLVLGDLNCGEDSAALHALRDAGLRDTFRDAQPDVEEVGTFGGFRGRTDGAKIDYVLADAGFETVTAKIDHRSFDGHDPSDHFPVHADVRFTVTGPQPRTLVLDAPPIDLTDRPGDSPLEKLALQPTWRAEQLVDRTLEHDGFRYRVIPVRGVVVDVLRATLEDPPVWQQAGGFPAGGAHRPTFVRVLPTDQLFLVDSTGGKTLATPLRWE